MDGWPPDWLREAAQKEDWDQAPRWRSFEAALDDLDCIGVGIIEPESETPTIELSGIWEQINREDDQPFREALDRAIVVLRREYGTPSERLERRLKALGVLNVIPRKLAGSVEPKPSGVWLQVERGTSVTCTISDMQERTWTGTARDALERLGSLPIPAAPDEVWAALIPPGLEFGQQT
jgi:hypothetical protein